jgi:hypothetical protein
VAKDIDERDIEFVEEAIRAIRQREAMNGGPRMPEDMGRVVQNLVVATNSLQESSKALQATVSSIMAVLEGRTFGDKTDGLTFRVGKLERAQRNTNWIGRTVLAGVAWLVGRSGYVVFQHQIETFFHSLGIMH